MYVNEALVIQARYAVICFPLILYCSIYYGAANVRIFNL